MKKRLSAILPILLITVLVVVAVEGFYLTLEKYLFVTQKVLVSSQNIQKSVGEENGTGDEFRNIEEIDYSVIVSRNLFGPPPEPKQTVMPEEQEIDDLEASQLDVVLMGTVGGGDGEARAIILNKKDRKQELYRVGDAIEGALIKKVKRGQVILNYNGKDEMLDITEAANYRSQTPASVSRSRLPSRRRVVDPQPEDVLETNEGRPMVVKPTRRIVRPRRVLTPDNSNGTDSDVEQLVPPEEGIPEVEQLVPPEGGIPEVPDIPTE